MWPFKKKINKDKFNKEAEKKCKKKLEEWGEKIKPKYDKDRFIVDIKKDGNRFLIKVFDEWTSIFTDKKEGYLNCRTIAFTLSEKELEKEEKYVLEVIDSAKEHLRKLFAEKRDKEQEKYDKKESKKSKKKEAII